MFPISFILRRHVIRM